MNSLSYKTWRRMRPTKPRSRKPFAPALPGLFRPSGLQCSDPDFWREQRENEEEAAKTKERSR